MENSTNKFNILDQYQTFTKNGPNVYSLIPGFSYAGTDPTLPLDKATPDTVQIKFGGKIHDIKFEHWNMIKYLGSNKFYCMICRFGKEKRIMIDHCKSEIHLDNMLKCGVVATGDNFFVRKAHTGMYHCGHCNNMQQTMDMDVHMQKYNLKITKTTNENQFSEIGYVSNAIKLQNEIDDHDKENINNNSLTNVKNLDTVEILSTRNNNANNNNNDKGSSLNHIFDSIKNSLKKNDNQAKIKYPDKTLKHILQQETNTTENYSKIQERSLKPEKKIKNEETKTNSEVENPDTDRSLDWIKELSNKNDKQVNEIKYPNKTLKNILENDTVAECDETQEQSLKHMMQNKNDETLDTVKILTMRNDNAIINNNNEDDASLNRSLDSIKDRSNKNYKQVDEIKYPNKTLKNILENETDLCKAEICDETQEQVLKQMMQNKNDEIKTNTQIENLDTIKNLSMRNDNAITNNNYEDDASLNRSLDSIKDRSNKIYKQVDQEVNPNITIKTRLNQDTNLNNLENEEKSSKKVKEIMKEENISEQSRAPKCNNDNIKVLEISKGGSNITLKQEIKTSRNDKNDRFSTEKNNRTQNLNKAKTGRCTSEKLKYKNNTNKNLTQLDNSRVKFDKVSNINTVRVNNIENNSNLRRKNKKNKNPKGGNCTQNLSPKLKQKSIFTNIFESDVTLSANGNNNQQNKSIQKENVSNEEKNVQKNPQNNNKPQKEEALNNFNEKCKNKKTTKKDDIIKNNVNQSVEIFKSLDQIETETQVEVVKIKHDMSINQNHKSCLRQKEINKHVGNDTKQKGSLNLINNEFDTDILCNINNKVQHILNEGNQENDKHLNEELDNKNKHDEYKQMSEKNVKIEDIPKQEPQKKIQSKDENTILPNIKMYPTNNITKNENNTRSNPILEHVLNAIESERNNSVLQSNVKILGKTLAEIRVRFEKQEANIKSLQKNNLNLCEKHQQTLNSDSDDEIVSVDEVDELCSEMDRVKLGLNQTLIHLKKRVHIIKDCDEKELKNYKDNIFDELKKINADLDSAEEKLDEKLNQEKILIERAKISMNAELNTSIFFKEINSDKKSRGKVINDIENAHKIVLDSLMQIKCKLQVMHSYSGDTLETTKLDLSMLKKRVNTSFYQEVEKHSEAVGRIKIDEGNKKNIENATSKNQNLRIGNLDISITNNTDIKNNKSILNTNQSKVDKKFVDETKNLIFSSSIETDIDSLIEFIQMPNNSIYFIYFVTRMTAVVNVFGHKLTVTYMSLNTIKETMINLKCVACGTVFHDDQLVKHLFGTHHLQQVKKYGFMTEFSINAIRKIDRHFHCAICNLLLPSNPSIALLHNTTIEHRLLLQRAFEFEHNQTHQTLNTYTGTNLDTEQVPTTSNNQNDEIKQEISKCDLLSDNIPTETKYHEHTMDTSTNNNCGNNIERDDEMNRSKDLYIIANLCDVYINLKMEAWHTLILTVDDDLFCFVCDELTFFGRILSEKLSHGKQTYYNAIKEHTESNDHFQNLIKHKILTDFNTNMIRERSIHCHCAICNLACLKIDIIAHINSHSHIENHKKSIFLDISLIDDAADYTAVNVMTQKMATSINETKDHGVENSANVEHNVEMTFKVVIPENNWQGVVSTPNGFRCILCNVNFKKKQYEQHIYSRTHDNRVENRQFEEYQDDLIHKLDMKRMHCILCNIELAPIDVAAHINGKKHKDNKMTILNK